MEPTEEQKKIIDLDEDTIVIANPGTGKTTTLAFKVIKLLKENVEPEEILCITYTEKAKKEMYEAIREISNGEIADSVLLRVNIHTFHSFAYHYLLDGGQITGNVIGNNILRYAILQSFEKNNVFNYQRSYIIDDIVPKVENAIRYIKNFGITPDKIDLGKVEAEIQQLHDETRSSFSTNEMIVFSKKFVEVYKDYEAAKNEQIDYADMLLLFTEKYSGRKFKYVLVDEMQDMNEIEASIVKNIYENLFLVGDSKQAIFGFQGGSIKNFTDFQKICTPMYLSENKRSTQEILNFAKEFFLGKTQYLAQYERELKDFRSMESGPLPEIFVTEAPFVKILDVINLNRDKKIGVITRTNSSIIEISKFLDAYDIDYISTSAQATTAQAREEISKFLKGVISDDMKDKIPALFTFFSPNSIQDAFAISEEYTKNKSANLPAIYHPGSNLTKDELDSLFTDVIMPICVARGSEWLSTAHSVKIQIDEYLSLVSPSLAGLFDFISIVEESRVETNVDSQVTLTTVHKAKGRSFDIVLYLPTSKKKISFVDTIVTSILHTNGYNIEDELIEEGLRVDFVSLTRAKEKLIVLPNDATSGDYQIDNRSTVTVDNTDKKEQEVQISTDFRLSEAYSLFVAGDVQHSQELLNKTDDWLEQKIKDYFANLDHLSHSAIITDPYLFFKRRILNLQSSDKFSGGGLGREFGAAFHPTIQKVLENDAKVEDYDGNTRKALENAMAGIEQLKNEFSGLKFEDAEFGVKVKLSSITNYTGDLDFTGKIDAVFKHDNGTLLVDWKTDKKAKSEHKQQLAAYKKAYSLQEGIPEDEIKTCVVYVSLRGSINTGKFDLFIDHAGNYNFFGTFERHLKKILEWIDNPGKFIEEFTAMNETEALFEILKSKLVKT